MNLLEMQYFVNQLCSQYPHSPIPVIINKRFKLVWGRAHWGINERIEISESLSNQPDAIQKSVLIHEFCHIYLKQGHTLRFFDTSAVIHMKYNLREDRETVRTHGMIYENGEYVEQTYGKSEDKIPD